MRNRLILMGFVLGLAAGPAIADDETELAKKMEAMDDAYKGFRREKDPEVGAAEARNAQEAALKSLVEVPEMLKGMPDGPAKAKAMAEYRKMVGRVFVTFCEVEEAFLNGKIDEVAGLVDSLKKMKKEGHDKFIEEED